MRTPNLSRLLLLLFCILSISISEVSAQTEAPKERTSVRLPTKYHDARLLAEFITRQVDGSYLEIAAASPPSLATLEKYLPSGTVATGNQLALPNGTNVTIVKSKTEKEYEAEFLANSITREQLIRWIANIPAESVIVFKIKRPDTKQWTSIKDKKRALELAQTLPSGSYVVGELRDSTKKTVTYRLPRLR